MKVFIKKLRVLFIFLWISMIILPISAEATENETIVVSSGTCGENLKWVLFEDGVLTISGTGEMDSYTYYDAKDATNTPWDLHRWRIKKVVVEDGVTSIGRCAFWECEQLEEVILGNGVETIKENAFIMCKSMHSVTFGSGIKTIEKWAFFNCFSLLNVYAPDIESWCKIAFDADQANPAGTRSIYDEATNSWVEYDSILYFDGVPVEGELIVPKTVTEWGNSSFSNNRKITSVIFEEGTIEIGDGAFSGCSNLSSVSIPESVVAIGNSSFGNCPNLLSVNIPENVTTIGAGAFWGCLSLKDITIPSRVVVLEDSIFKGCSNLADITLHDNIKKFGNNAFTGCAFTEMKIPESVVSIGDEAFSECIFTEIVIPDTVTEIGEGMFNSCSNLKSVTWPETMESIGSKMFYGCSSLESIVLPKETKVIGEEAFVGCTNLKSVTLSDSLIRIDSKAFNGVGNLATMELPDSVTTIGEYAFQNLSNWENAKVPANVETIGAYAYDGCSKLSAIELPDSLTDLGDCAFLNCSGATEVVLSGTLNSILKETFKGCSGIESVVIPASVLEIGSKVFEGCSKLTMVHFEGDVPVIDTTAFNGVTATCYYPEGNETYTAEITTVDYGGDLFWTYEGEKIKDEFYKCGESLTWELNDSGTLIISGNGEMYDYSVTDLEYAPWYESRTSITAIEICEGVTGIGNGAFYGCSSVGNINFADSLTSIGDQSFEGCSMSELVLPEGITEVGSSAFATCKRITEVTLPDSLTFISNKMFYECTALVNVAFPEMITTIGTSAFESCYYLSSVTLPEGLVSIGDYAFRKCGTASDWGGYNFQYVKLPTTLKSIGEGAFIWCSCLREINLPEGLEKIGTNTFWRCTSLNNLVIPDSVQSIANGAFYYCYNLTNIYFVGDPPVFGNDSLDVIPNKTSFMMYAYYPENNDVWTSDVLQQYGGKVTWVPYEAEDSGEDSGESGGTTGGDGIGTYTFAIISQPEEQSVSIGENAVFVVEATGDGLTYQWQYSNSKGKYWYDSGMEGAGTSSLTVPVLKKRDGQMYRCLVKDTYGNELYSETAVLILYEETMITIVAQPESQAAVNGTNVVFTIEAEGNGLIYQWQYSTNGKYWFNSGMEGAGTSNLTVPVIEKRNNQQYRCVITDTNGNEVVSDVAVLTVGEAFQIITQPGTQTVEVGEDATFTVEADGENLTYQWQYSKNGTYWFNSGMEGADTQSLIVKALAKRADQQYRCVITDINDNKVVSETAVLNIK